MPKTYSIAHDTDCFWRSFAEVVQNTGSCRFKGSCLYSISDCYTAYLLVLGSFTDFIIFPYAYPAEIQDPQLRPAMQSLPSMMSTLSSEWPSFVVDGSGASVSDIPMEVQLQAQLFVPDVHRGDLGVIPAKVCVYAYSCIHIECNCSGHFTL